MWVKSKCFNRAEFVIVGWSKPEGSRHPLVALLLGYYDPKDLLVYAGRVGTGMSVETLAMLHARLAPLAIPTMPLTAPPPRDRRFGRPLAISKVHWVRPELVAEITYLGWTEEGCCATRSSWGCARTNEPARSAANCPAARALGCLRCSLARALRQLKADRFILSPQRARYRTCSTCNAPAGNG